MSDIVVLRIVETVNYGADFTVAELNELCAERGAPTLEDTGGDVLAWLQDVVSDLIRDSDRMLEDIEHKSGDVQGQEWAWSRASG